MKMLKLSLKSKLNPYSRKLHKAEISLIIGVVCAMALGAWLDSQQDALAEDMIRLHVVANSNSEFDQNLKYDVRDQILLETQEFYKTGLTATEVEELFLLNLEAFVLAGESVSQGQTVSARLTDLWFPTKEYDTFSLPAGEYRALEITLGEGEGENWWCVAYPPLCVGAVSQTMEEIVEAGNFTEYEMQMVTGESYVLKFKSIELWENLKKKLS